MPLHVSGFQSEQSEGDVISDAVISDAVISESPESVAMMNNMKLLTETKTNFFEPVFNSKIDYHKQQQLIHLPRTIPCVG